MTSIVFSTGLRGQNRTFGKHRTVKMTIARHRDTQVEHIKVESLLFDLDNVLFWMLWVDMVPTMAQPPQILLQRSNLVGCDFISNNPTAHQTFFEFCTRYVTTWYADWKRDGTRLTTELWKHLRTVLCRFCYVCSMMLNFWDILVLGLLAKSATPRVP